ncbi:alkaline phosphatase D family protein [Adhaeribacter pallidiroseus]|uniref:Alkaline phosphatase n=1 Tax=Adhaeribacter pallidiroseus TaxID=2072847 RepID=A0A369QHK9_9BACT|nr:alkaline phosphatase family protein [Adhaeribacter pallidiroseus]RDC62706.1 Alkaline phosphatase [Adhaeribacter pallidiroseus]
MRKLAYTGKTNFMIKDVVMGPVLGFRGLKNGHWYTSALVVLQKTAEPPRLRFIYDSFSKAEENKVLLKTYADHYVWRLDWSVSQTSWEQVITYAVNEGPTYHYTVPAQNSSLRICYGSCFGVHTLQDINKLKKKNALWHVLQQVHQAKPYHLFVLGGDQVYSDQVWEKVPALRQWLGQSLKKRLQASFTPDMQQQVAAFYFNLYCKMWRQKRPAAVLSQIPTLMMWDDHDIFDGWGSYVPELQACAVFQGIYQQAQEHFHVFQLQAQDHADLGAAIPLGKNGFTYAHRLNDVLIIALDLRSERTRDQVLSLETHQSLQTWLASQFETKPVDGTSSSTGCKHILVLSGIPIVNADLTLLEAVLELRPGQQRMEDDLKDQWLSRAHQEERLRLIQWLFRISQEFNCQVTILSGDAHLAFTGYLQTQDKNILDSAVQTIHQLTSSAMVNVPPPSLVIYMMEKLLAGKTEKVDDQISAYLQNFPGTNRHLIGARNWLSLSINEEATILAEWYVEGEKQPYSKIIEPLQ